MYVVCYSCNVPSHLDSTVNVISVSLYFSQMMQTNVDGVFAGGDVVTFPLALRGNKKVNIPHWQMAHVHGKRLFGTAY